MVYGVCMCVCVENFPEFCQCSQARCTIPCQVLGAPAAAAPGQLDSQDSTADVVVPTMLAVCCSPTGRTTSPQLEGSQIQFMAERQRESVILLFVAAAAAAARALLLFTFLYFNFDTIFTSCC